MSNLILGAVPSLQIGGVIFTDLVNLKVLRCHTVYSGGLQRGTVREANGVAGYTPSGTKKFRVKAIRTFNYGSATATMQMAQSDNDVGFSGAAALTNPVYPWGTAGEGVMLLSATAGEIRVIETNFVIQNGKFLSFDQGSVAAGTQFVVEAFGYEE